MPRLPWDDDDELEDDNGASESWKMKVYPTSLEIYEDEDWPEPDPDAPSEYNLYRRLRDEGEGG